MPLNRVGQHLFALLGAWPAPSRPGTLKPKLDYTIEVIEKYFWSEEEQMPRVLGTKP